MKVHIFAILVLAFGSGFYCEAIAQNSSAFRIARLKYDGGGDWYNGPLEEPTLLKFVTEKTFIDVDPSYYFADINTNAIFSYSLLFMTGHGNIHFTQEEANRLRLYLEEGGFLYADDDYGMDESFRREIRKVFPEKSLVPLPFSYGLYRCVFEFPNGTPQTHDWGDKKPPMGYGIFIGERLAVFYTAESNPSDGWDPAEVHGDPESKRTQALEFGTNVIYWALTH